MIPNLQPPPSFQPQGWSPNGLATNIVASSIEFEAAYEALRLALTPGFLYTHTITLNQAQMLAINTTPVDVVPAPGAGLFILPIYWKCLYSGGTPAFSTGSALFFRYSGAFSGTTISDTGSQGEINNNRRSSAVFPALSAGFGAVSPADPPMNQSLQVTAAANWTGAGVINSFQISTTYALLSTPLP